MIKFATTLFLLSVVVFCPNVVSAKPYRLPEVMVGQTRVEVGGGSKVYYGGMTGNEAILNSDTNFSQDHLTGFNSSVLVGTPASPSQCFLLKLATDVNCFRITPSDNLMSIMTSKTFVNNDPILEVATLLSPSKLIIGDVYTQSEDDIRNFSFFGRNLYKSGDEDASSFGTNVTWTEPFYSFNADAQSSFEGEQQDYYVERKNLLKGEADTYVGTLGSHENWSLQSENLVVPGTSDLFPEGKVWRIDGSVTLDTTYNYSGK